MNLRGNEHIQFLRDPGYPRNIFVRKLIHLSETEIIELIHWNVCQKIRFPDITRVDRWYFPKGEEDSPGPTDVEKLAKGHHEQIQRELQEKLRGKIPRKMPTSSDKEVV